MQNNFLNILSNPYRGILLDAYGVFWGGSQVGVLPGCRETMEALVAQGKIVGILSNASQLAKAEKEKLAKHGLFENQHYHFFLTSGEITKQLLSEQSLPFPTPKKSYYLFGEDHPRFASHKVLFEGSPYRQTDLEAADFVYVAIPHIEGHDQTDPEAFRDKLIAIKKAGLPLVVANPDHFAHEGSPPRAVVRQGAIGSLYEEMGGRVFYVGKPFDTPYAQAMKHFVHYGICDPAHVLMVGDTPETDIRGAKNFGMPSALTTRTGMMAERNKALTDQPTYFIDSLGFTLHPNLAKKIHVADLPLCRVLLENESHYPWLLLVPRRPTTSRLIDLSPSDQLQLLKELDLAQQIIWKTFNPTQLNVAAIGNKTPQLHIHVMGRYDTDPAWPQTVWDHPVRTPYTEEKKKELILLLNNLLHSK